MSRSHRFRHQKNRHIKTASDSRRSEASVAVLKAHNLRMRTLRDCFAEEIASIYGELTKNAAVSISETALYDSYVSKYDAVVFGAYKNIIACYCEYKKRYLKMMENIKSKEAYYILSGLDEIISLRLKESEIPEGKDPVFEEKNRIVNGYVSVFLMDCSNYAKVCFSELLSEAEYVASIIRHDLDEKLLNEIYASISHKTEQLFCETLYKAYSQNLKTALVQVNFEENRKELSKYIQMLGEEVEILSSIVKVQVFELEKYKDDQEEIYEIMNLIREAYQKAKHDADIIEGYLNNPGIEINDTPAYDSFMDICKPSEKQTVNFSTAKEVKTQFEVQDRNLSVLLSGFGKRIFDKGMFLNFNDNHKNRTLREIERTSLLTNEIIEEFKKVIVEEIEIKDSLMQEKEIVKGINDTLIIKVESLEENLSEHEENIKELKSFNFNINTIANESFFHEYEESLYTAFLEKFKEIQDIDRETILKVRKTVKSTADIYVGRALELYNKKINSKLEPLVKKDTGFKRDSLLFEISTFEEIMKYSISRLKECEDEKVAAYVASIEKMSFNIENILATYNIFPIDPAEHSMFNAKEHEVLMAEKAEGFAKGEIVKVLARGYRQGDSVLVRANVQAAR